MGARLFEELGVGVEGLEEGGETRLPTGGFEFCVLNAFVGPTAFAVEVDGPFGWEGGVEAVGEVFVEVALGDGMIVDRVEKPSESFVDGVDHGVGGVLMMDLVDPTIAIALDDGGSVEEFAEEDAATGAIDSAEADDEATESEDVLFGFEEELTGFGSGCGRGFFVDGGAVRLGEDGGASGVSEEFGDEKGVEVFGAVEIDAAIGIGSAFSGACAMDDGMGADEVTETGLDFVGIRDVAGADLERFRCEAMGGFLRVGAGGHVPPELVKISGDLEADEAASCDEGVGSCSMGIGEEGDGFGEHVFSVEIEGAGEALSCEDLWQPFTVIGPHAVVWDLGDGGPEGFCFIGFGGGAVIGACDEDFAEEAVTVGEPEPEHSAGFEVCWFDVDLFEGFANGGLGGRFAGFDLATGRVDVSCAEAAFFLDEKDLITVDDEAEDGAVDGGPVDPVA